ncbi:MAG: hypothetical protein ACM3SQ_19170 [Betaproteobacteria bacterium]
MIVSLALVASGCAAGKAFRQGNLSMKAGDLDQAVAYYRAAVQASPDNPNYKIALERAMLAASRAHLDKAKQFEQAGQLEAALGEYKQASEYDPSNQSAAAKIASLEQTIRDRIEASRPKPPIEAMRAQARRASAEPILNPASREPLNIRFNNASLRDILNFIANATGINIMYDREFADRPATVQLDGVTLEQALDEILSVNQFSYKVLNPRTILIFPDTAQKHAQYDEQVIRTFYVSHADVTELSQMLSVLVRLPGISVQPAIALNKAGNSITVRATKPVVDIIGRIIQQNDKPRAEIVVDVELLEVDRSRAKQYGLNLSDYAIGGLFSPEVSPSGTTTQTGTGTGTTPGTGTGTGTATTTTATGTSTGPSQLKPSPPFNLNTISRGVTTADFYLAVPTAIVRFLESDTHTKVLAKPQLRGAEGTKLSLALGQQIPIVSTSYTPIATGGVGVNPLSSYQYKDVGVNIDMTPRVTLDGDITLDLHVQNSQVGADKSIAGVTVPSFVNREVTTRLRLRDGESNLLAGLLQETDQNSISGFPGAIHVPFFKQLFSSNNQTTDQTDIVMLLTPHIVRTQEITVDDLKPIYIGSQGNLGVGGPPPLIAAPEPAAPPAAPPGQQTFTTASGAVVAAPPGSTPIPGTVLVQPPAPAATAPPPPAGAAPTPTPETPPAAAGEAAPGGVATPPAQPATPPITSPGVGQAQIILTPPGTTFRVGAGPYTVPISVVGAVRLSTVTLTLTFDPNVLRVRSVQEGSFMRSGGVNVTFSQQVNGGRVDITLARAADATGASGTGLLAAVLLDPVAPGTATLTLSGTATGPGGTAMGLAFRPVTVTVQR